MDTAGSNAIAKVWRSMVKNYSTGEALGLARVVRSRWGGSGTVVVHRVLCTGSEIASDYRVRTEFGGPCARRFIGRAVDRNFADVQFRTVCIDQCRRPDRHRDEGACATDRKPARRPQLKSDYCTP